MTAVELPVLIAAVLACNDRAATYRVRKRGETAATVTCTARDVEIRVRGLLAYRIERLGSRWRVLDAAGVEVASID